MQVACLWGVAANNKTLSYITSWGLGHVQEAFFFLLPSLLNFFFITKSPSPTTRYEGPPPYSLTLFGFIFIACTTIWNFPLSDLFIVFHCPPECTVYESSVLFVEVTTLSSSQSYAWHPERHLINICLMYGEWGDTMGSASAGLCLQLLPSPWDDGGGLEGIACISQLSGIPYSLPEFLPLSKSRDFTPWARFRLKCDLCRLIPCRQWKSDWIINGLL